VFIAVAYLRSTVWLILELNFHPRFSHTIMQKKLPSAYFVVLISNVVKCTNLGGWLFRSLDHSEILTYNFQSHTYLTCPAFVITILLSFMFCWPCIAIYLCDKNQIHILFILSLFRQSTSTCFEHICSPSSGGILYVYNTYQL
jgi:hypothetical protein